MTTPCTPYKLVEVIEKRRHIVRVEGHFSDEEAKVKAKNGEGEIASPYPPEISCTTVIGGSDEDQGDE